MQFDNTVEDTSQFVDTDNNQPESVKLNASQSTKSLYF